MVGTELEGSNSRSNLTEVYMFCVNQISTLVQKMKSYRLLAKNHPRPTILVVRIQEVVANRYILQLCSWEH